MNTIPAAVKNKVALITGGSRGIGASVARKLAQQGCSHIAITYNSNKTQAEIVLASIRSEVSPNVKTLALAADLLDPGFGPNTIAQTRQGLGVDHIDIVVSSAAILDTSAMSPVADMPKSEFDALITANAWAPLSLARSAVQHMPPGGRIILLSSVSSRLAQGDPFIAYGASKSALDSISRNLAAVWAKEKGIIVNSVSVGATRTDSLSTATKVFGGDAYEEAIKGFSLLGRVGEAEDVAGVVGWLAGPDAGWVVGQQIPANGGGIGFPMC